MAIKTYTKGSRATISKNFQAYEFDCSCGRCRTTPIDMDLVAILQKERDHFGKPVMISSGYRCPAHNAETPHASNTSYHTKGMAADHYINGVTPAEQAKYLESIGANGVGLYETAEDGFFVHTDTRPTKTFWYGQAQAYRSTFGGKAVEEPVAEPSVPRDDGEYSEADFVADVQEVLGTDATGAELLSLTPTLSRNYNRKHPLVECVQLRLLELGYNLGEDGADGRYGPMTANAVAAYQRDNDCIADGVISAHKRTWECLLGI